MVGVQSELQTARWAFQAVRVQRGRMVHCPVSGYLNRVVVVGLFEFIAFGVSIFDSEMVGRVRGVLLHNAAKIRGKIVEAVKWKRAIN